MPRKWTRSKGYVWNRLSDDWRKYSDVVGENPPTSKSNMYNVLEIMENQGLIEVLRYKSNIHLYRLPQPKK